MRTILGLDQIDDYLKILKGKRIGLITNYSGVNSEWEVNVDLFIRKGLNIVRIFTPEHGMYGKGAGKAVDDDLYAAYCIPITSLFGETFSPNEEQLSNIDILVYDIQDVGLRYYTYIYTLTYCMEKASLYSIPFIVLDRPNPLGNSIISGGRLRKEYASFIGDYNLPLRYALTPGEMGYYYIQYKKLTLNYAVISLKNYTRDTYFPDTQGVWNIPSPALSDFDSTICYAGGCYAGATTLSDGRGSAKPFQMYGAPFIKMEEFYRELKTQIHEDNVIFRERAFIPTERKYKGQICYGVEFAPLDKTVDFLPVALKMLRTAAKLYPENFDYVIGDKGIRHLRYLSGDCKTEDYIEGRISLTDLTEDWKESIREFEAETKELRLYQ